MAKKVRNNKSNGIKREVKTIGNSRVVKTETVGGTRVWSAGPTMKNYNFMGTMTIDAKGMFNMHKNARTMQPHDFSHQIECVYILSRSRGQSPTTMISIKFRGNRANVTKHVPTFMINAYQELHPKIFIDLSFISRDMVKKVRERTKCSKRMARKYLSITRGDVDQAIQLAS